MTALSPLDQLMPRSYIRQVFCFPSTHTDAPKVLKAGLAGVIIDVPYLLSGIFASKDSNHISLTEPYQTLEDLYYEQDLSDAINYTIVKEQHFPPSSFTRPGIIPPDTLPPFPNPTPVLRVRVSLVKGGFILCVAIHHCTTDITGFGTLLKIWASHCRTGTSAAVGFDSAWLDRRIAHVWPSTSNATVSVSTPELLHVREANDVVKRDGLASHSHDLETDIFFFPLATLRSLKHAVNEHITSQGRINWVSSGDILTALLWGAILTAESESTAFERNPAIGLDATSTIGLPVNFRSRYNPSICSNYLGAAFVMTAATTSLADLVSFATSSNSSTGDDPLDPVSLSRLADIAVVIRTAVHHVDERSVRDVLAYLEAAPNDHPPIALGPRHGGISIVSWADQGVYELDWGNALGRCDTVRLPKLTQKRYPIVLPRIPAGPNRDEEGLEVIVSFDKQMMRKFEQSWPIRRFAILRCPS